MRPSEAVVKSCAGYVALTAALMWSLPFAIGAAQESRMPKPQTPRMAPMRDPEIAVQEELDAARRSQSVASYDLFLARHPDSPLAEVARQERRALEGVTTRSPQ